MIDIEQGLWHTLLPLADDTVVLEIKRGPYEGATDKLFAAWSPEEGTPEAIAWVSDVIGPQADHLPAQNRPLMVSP